MTKHKHHIDFTALLGLHRMNTYIHSYINHNEELWDTSGVLCSRHTYSWRNSLLVTFENAGWSSFNLPHEIEMIHFSQLTHYIYWHNDCSSKSRSIPHLVVPEHQGSGFYAFPSWCIVWDAWISNCAMRCESGTPIIAWLVVHKYVSFICLHLASPKPPVPSI